MAVSGAAVRRRTGGSSSPPAHPTRQGRPPALPNFADVRAVDEELRSVEVIRTSIRRAVVPGIAVLALALTGCGAGNSSDTDSASDSSSSGGASLSGELAGGGASSQESAQTAWRAGFQTANSGVTITYDAVGSGTGRENFIN